ncbi:MAG: hypothetical protein V4714_11110 [Bacteroidota bacterium]
MSLPINLESLLHSCTVESDRIEFKEGWNPDAIYRSVCAFANDLENIGRVIFVMMRVGQYGKIQK